MLFMSCCLNVCVSFILPVRRDVLVEFCTHLSFYPSSEEYEARGLDNTLLGELYLRQTCHKPSVGLLHFTLLSLFVLLQRGKLEAAL